MNKPLTKDKIRVFFNQKEGMVYAEGYRREDVESAIRHLKKKVVHYWNSSDNLSGYDEMKVIEFIDEAFPVCKEEEEKGR